MWVKRRQRFISPYFIHLAKLGCKALVRQQKKISSPKGHPHGKALLVSHCLERFISFLHHTTKLGYDRLSQAVATKQSDSDVKYWSSPLSPPLFLCQHKSSDFCKVIHTQIHPAIVLSIKPCSPGLKAAEDTDFSCPNFSRKGAQNARDSEIILYIRPFIIFIQEVWFDTRQLYHKTTEKYKIL